MKMQSRLLAGLAAMGLAALVATGCVDEEPSMQLSGSVLFQGSVSEGSEDGQGTIECEVAVDPGSIESFSTRGSIDLGNFAEQGQFGPPFPTEVDTQTRTIEKSPTHDSFVFWAAIENRLADSTEVGAEGQGGGTGGYNGLELDQNAIRVTSAEIQFPGDLNNFPGGGAASSLNKTVNFSAVLPSNGGGAVVHFPIFSGREVNQQLQNFYDGVVGGQSDIVPLVAEIQIKGETFAGTKVESNRLRFPIDICGSCDPAGDDAVDQFTTSPTCDVQSGSGASGGG